MTTSPLTTPEIESAFGDGDPSQPLAPSPDSLSAEWRRFANFLKRPTLPAHSGRSPGKIKGTLRMLWLDLPIMAAFIAVLSLVPALGFELPENVNATLELSVWTLALIVLIVPVIEELVFRSWLNGVPWVMALVGFCTLGVIGVPLALNALDPERTMPIFNLLAVVFVMLGLSMALLMRHWPVPGFFAPRFAIFFWAATGGFALVHLGNYSEGSLALLLPLILPQFALGAMVGYLRVHYGLITAIALHAAHNGILFGLASLGAKLAGDN